MKKISFILILWMVFNVHAQNTQVQDSQAPDPLKLLQDVREGLSGLNATFLQYELVEGNERLDPNSGHVWMQSPDKFRWHYFDPIEQLIVADGKQVWVYDEDLEQVTVKAQSNQLNPIYVIINDDKSQQHYHIKHEINNQGIDWISLTPKEASDEVKTVWLAIKDKQVRQIKVVNNFSQTMVFEFSEIKKNPDFEKGLFTFVPPEGVDVVQAISENTSAEF